MRLKDKKETKTKREKQRRRDEKTTYMNMYTYRMYLSCSPIRTHTQNNKLGTATREKGWREKRRGLKDK